VDVLLDEIEALIREVEAVNMTHFIPAPWPALDKIKADYKTLRDQLNHYKSSEDKINSLLLNMDLEFTATDLLRRARMLEQSARTNKPPAVETLKEAESVIGLLDTATQKIKGNSSHFRSIFF